MRLLPSLTALLKKDLREAGPAMLTVAIMGTTVSSLLALRVEVGDNGLLAMTASIALLGGAALPATAVLREKTRGTWDWLRLLVAHPRTLVAAKLLSFLTFYAALCLSLIPLWVRAGPLSEVAAGLSLWFILTAAGWIVGCLVLAISIAAERGYLGIMLGLCAAEMFLAASLMLGADESSPLEAVMTMAPRNLMVAAAVFSFLGVGAGALTVMFGARMLESRG